MKKAIGIILSVRYVFNFRKPHFESIHFSRIIMQGHAYFLFTWYTTNALYIRDRKIRFHSRFSSGSAYCRVPEGTKQIELVIGNLWQSNKLLLPLTAIPTEEIVLPSFAKPAVPLPPSTHLPLPKPVHTPNGIRVPVPVPDIHQPSVQNLSYHI
jgi:hypothetical protein